MSAATAPASAGLIDALPGNVHARIDLPERQERLKPAPEMFLAGGAAPAIASRASEGSLWQHQSLALAELEAGRNVVISTGTASGKSLIFQTYAFHRLGERPDAAALVVDPLRALAEDQLHSWRQAAEQCRLPPESVVKIDGTVPMPEREGLLEQAAVAIVTPDIIHAWLLRNSDRRAVRDFVARLETVVLDEAHVYESVFGSNVAFLIRRLLTLRQAVSGAAPEPCRIIGATATIINASGHMEDLTGLPFVEVGEELNGARTYPRSIVHIDGDGEDDMADVLRRIVEQRSSPKFIAFVNSRQGVERIARQLGRRVMPYRNGYEARDRRQIEIALREGQLDGVVSTSALELGINIPNLTLGLNLNLPGSRKSFRQRLGRVGRDAPGAFVVVGAANLFSRYGQTLQEYYDESAEPSVLYLNNRYVQFSNAQCLLKEAGRSSLGQEALAAVAWPDGFGAMLDYAGVSLRQVPNELAAIAAIGSRYPHRAHGVRNITEAEISLHDAHSGKRIGYISLRNAIREAYPGAHYLHAGRNYQIQEWRHKSYGKIEIYLSDAPQILRTEPVPQVEVVVREIENKNLARHDDGASYLAEVSAEITETVMGYTEGRQTRMYRPEVRQSRRFETTGALLRIKQEWAEWIPYRDAVGRALVAILRYDRSIANFDIDYATEPVQVAIGSHPQRLAEPAVLVYDNCHGSLHLTEPLFRDFSRYLRQLQQSTEVDGEMISKEIIAHLVRWGSGLKREEAG